MKKFLAVLSASFLFSCAHRSGNSIPVEMLTPGEGGVEYRIDPVIDGNNLELSIDVFFKGEADGVTDLLLPDERIGDKRQYEGIHDLEILSDETALHDGEMPNLKTLSYPPGGIVGVRYRIRALYADSFTKSAPIIKKDFIQFLGRSILAKPVLKNTKNLTFSVVWRNPPDTWKFASSWGVNKTGFYFPGTLDTLMNSVFLAGDFRIYALENKEGSAYVAIRGNWNFSDNDLEKMLNGISLGKHNFWSPQSENKFFLITLTPIHEAGCCQYEGTKIQNAFVSFMTHNKKLDKGIGFFYGQALMKVWPPPKEKAPKKLSRKVASASKKKSTTNIKVKAKTKKRK